jgi:hypothetical protein
LWRRQRGSIYMAAGCQELAWHVDACINQVISGTTQLCPVLKLILSAARCIATYSFQAIGYSAEVCRRPQGNRSTTDGHVRNTKFQAFGISPIGTLGAHRG